VFILKLFGLTVNVPPLTVSPPIILNDAPELSEFNVTVPLLVIPPFSAYGPVLSVRVPPLATEIPPFTFVSADTESVPPFATVMLPLTLILVAAKVPTPPSFTAIGPFTLMVAVLAVGIVRPPQPAAVDPPGIDMPAVPLNSYVPETFERMKHPVLIVIRPF
jgi:hypothetical protein